MDISPMIEEIIESLSESFVKNVGETENVCQQLFKQLPADFEPISFVNHSRRICYPYPDLILLSAKYIAYSKTTAAYKYHVSWYRLDTIKGTRINTIINRDMFDDTIEVDLVLFFDNKTKPYITLKSVPRSFAIECISLISKSKSDLNTRAKELS